jgi:hypothetical protein
LGLDLLALPSVVLVAVTATGILISHAWRWVISLLMLQYAGIFILVGISWPFQMALTKLIAGLMAGVILFIAHSSLEAKDQDQARHPPILNSQTELSGKLFRLFAASLVGLVIVSGSRVIVQWLPGLSSEQILGSTILIGLGLLHLGLTSEPFRVVVGLLTVIAGFEIAYAGIEVSALVQGLLAVVTLGLGLVGAYLVLAPTMERIE